MKQFMFSILLIFIASSTIAQDKPEGLFINSKAPEFKAKDQHGRDVNLKKLRKKGFVVLMFYRGNWCPYCNKELKRFQDSLQFLTDKNITVLAITPEAAEGINKTVEKTGATFPVVFDADMKISKAYQVAFKVDETTANRYKEFGSDLLLINQQKEPSLPVPAVYIVNRDGFIIYRYFDLDYKNRPWVKDIIAQIK